jgi:chromosome segregation ATPase
VSVRDRLTGIDTNLDDLQSGLEAGSREADRIQNTARRIERLQLKTLESADLLGTLARHVKELQVCVRDQRAAMDELRATVARLRNELAESNIPVRPLATAADRQRR